MNERFSEGYIRGLVTIHSNRLDCEICKTQKFILSLGNVDATLMKLLHEKGGDNNEKAHQAVNHCSHLFPGFTY